MLIYKRKIILHKKTYYSKRKRFINSLIKTIKANLPQNEFYKKNQRQITKKEIEITDIMFFFHN